ncbi:MarR family winged helix-turn-helix transcriptional regulator [Streptomyces sp. NPDC060048]|uniref:MarR family winged helix-turn-helix transcriptional regulator n=1 Tax=unclassified Streptomyces TaxID=2593676 RepID=UPI0036C5B122
MASTSERKSGGGTPDGDGEVGLQAFAVQLRRLNGEINRVVHGFAHGQGLHPTDVQALSAILDSADPLTPGMLREHLGLTSGAVTACLDRLERAGHVTRTRDAADRRVVHVRYAADARAAARSYFMPLAAATDTALGQFSQEELAIALRFLAAVSTELGGVRPPRR